MLHKKKQASWWLCIFFLLCLMCLPAVIIYLAIFSWVIKKEKEEYGDPNDPYGGAVDWKEADEHDSV